MNRFAAILLSRQPLRPTGATAWVRQTIRAVHWLQQQRIGLASSVGTTPWELLTALAVINRLPLKLYLPHRSTGEFRNECEVAVREFGLDRSLTEFVPVPSLPKRDKRFMAERDRMVIESVNRLLPLSIRAGSSLSDLMNETVKTLPSIERSFQVRYDGRSTRLKADYFERSLSTDLPSSGRWLIHWTRGISQPWPGERKIDFYRDILNSESWPRSGFDTLLRILSGQRLIASTRHMPGRTKCVCLSSLSPKKVLPLMRWRARYREMSFEPYGVGIKSDLAYEVGIRPVRYSMKRAKDVDRDDVSWLSQSNGQKTDWRQEREYRHLGDLDLSAFPINSIRLFCASSGEADRLRQEFPYQVTALFQDA